MEIIIRTAEEKDATQIATLLTQLGYSCDSTFVKNKLLEFTASSSGQIYVAEADNAIAGMIAFDSQPLFHQSGKIGTIMALSVLDSHRGKGIGHKLVEFIEPIAKKAGCIKIAVASGVHREEAHKFYRSLGYEENTKRFVKQLKA